jgi:hypothetical protein
MQCENKEQEIGIRYEKLILIINLYLLNLYYEFIFPFLKVDENY